MATLAAADLRDSREDMEVAPVVGPVETVRITSVYLVVT